MGDQQQLGRVLGYQSLLFWQRCEYQPALAVGQRSLELAVQNQNTGMIIISKDVLSRVNYYLGDYPRALTLCEENINMLVGDLEREGFGMAGFESVHARRWHGTICAETGAFF